MDSEILQRARAYESRMEQEIREEERPGFHLTPRVGWMNDPNGFCRYGGRYHLFYQYHPYSTHWGPMHWGHAVSRDLIHWSYLPAALAPDADFDREGCFSGCALTLPDGRQELIYTGVSHGGIQTQCVAAGDGRDYKKEACNPVLSEKDLPPEVSPVDFRDPKAWQEADGTYRLLCAARSRDGGDTMFLLFESRDALHWRFVRTFLRNSELREPIGRMFECPDFFLLDGQYVLLASAQDMEGSAEYHSGNGNFCLLGDYDAAAGIFVPRTDQCVDAGVDFYAEQTVLAPDGRRAAGGSDRCRSRGNSFFGTGGCASGRSGSWRNFAGTPSPTGMLRLGKSRWRSPAFGEGAWTWRWRSKEHRGPLRSPWRQMRSITRI